MLTDTLCSITLVKFPKKMGRRKKTAKKSLVSSRIGDGLKNVMIINTCCFSVNFGFVLNSCDRFQSLKYNSKNKTYGFEKF